MPKQTDVVIEETPQYPRQVRLDTIARCNATCLSCHRFNTKRNGEMPVELFMKLLRDIGSWTQPLVETVPVNYGEFFLRKDWAWILEMIEKYLPNTNIVIPTNGSLLDDKAVDLLCQIQTLLLVNFSINAFFDDTYEAFMKLPAETIPKIRKAMERIKALRPEVYIRASMVFDPMYQTDSERDLFANHWKDIAEICIIPAASCGRDKPVVLPNKLPCRSIFKDLVVGYDGKLSNCCWDSNFTIPLGEYSGNLLKDWMNPKMEGLRKLHNEHRRDEIEICKFCSFA